jgi:hypothetical protein
MRRAIVIPAALVLSAAAAAAAVLPAGPPAAASSLIPTRLLINVSPRRVTPPSPQLAITGTLETLVASGQTPQPIAGEQVSLSLQSEGGAASQALGTFITDTDGEFSTTATAQVPGAVNGSFAGDGTYREASGGTMFEAAAQLPTRVTVEPITPVPYGSDVSVTALVTMQLPDGTWVPAPESPIMLSQCGSASEYGWTDSQGEWTATVAAVPPTDDIQCSFYTYGYALDAWTSQMLSPEFFVPLTTFPTDVTNFYPQSKRVPVTDIVLSGTAQWTDSSGMSHPDPGAAVQLEFLPAGTGNAWQRMATTTTATDGSFVFPRVSGYLPNGRLAAGLWRAVLPASGNYLAGESGNAVVVLTVPVFWSNVKIVRKGGTRYLTGAIRYLPHGGFLHGVKVALMTDVNGNIGHGPTITTGAGGTFSFRLAAPKRGQHVKYAVSFAGGQPPAWIDTDGYAVLDAAHSGWVSWS